MTLGYPDNNAERELLKGKDRKSLLNSIEPVLTAEELVQFQQQLEFVHVADALLDYLQDILEFSRASGNYNHGLSPRAGLAILNAAKGWALLHAHQHVLPEDIQAVLPSVIGHRLQFVYEISDKQALQPDQHLIQSVPVP